MPEQDHQPYHSPTGTFECVRKAVLEDPSLTNAEFRLLLYAATKPDGWKFYVPYLVKALGRTQYEVKTALKGLCQKGYAVAGQDRDQHGKITQWWYRFGLDLVLRRPGDESAQVTSTGPNSAPVDPACGNTEFAQVTSTGPISTPGGFRPQSEYSVESEDSQDHPSEDSDQGEVPLLIEDLIPAMENAVPDHGRRLQVQAPADETSWLTVVPDHAPASGHSAASDFPPSPPAPGEDLIPDWNPAYKRLVVMALRQFAGDPVITPQDVISRMNPGRYEFVNWDRIRSPAKFIASPVFRESVMKAVAHRTDREREQASRRAWEASPEGQAQRREHEESLRWQAEKEARRITRAEARADLAEWFAAGHDPARWLAAQDQAVPVPEGSTPAPFEGVIKEGTHDRTGTAAAAAAVQR